MENKRSRAPDVFVQVLVGPRGILKMGQIWLPLSLILAAGGRVDRPSRLGAALWLLYAVLSKGLSAILVNDLTDREIDKRAGKVRWITSLVPPTGIMIPVALQLTGFLALLAAGGDIPVLAAFMVSAVIGILYSVPPVRFKERGIWGVFAYPLSAAILHVLVPWALFRPDPSLLFLLLTVVIVEKAVQILFHQVVDFDSDHEGKVRSFASAAGFNKAGRALRIVLAAALAADAALLFFIVREMKASPPFAWLAGLACLLGMAASGLYVKIIAKRLRTSTALTDRLPWPYLGLSYTLFNALPPLLFVAQARREPEMWVLAALSALSLIGVSANAIAYDPRR